MKNTKIIVLIMLVGILWLFSGCTELQDTTNPIANDEVGVEDNTLKITLTGNVTPLRDVYDAPFPRLAMWWLDAYEESAETIARYDLLLNEFDDPELWDKVTEIRQINKDIILLRPISPSERDLHVYDSDLPNPAIASLPTSFFMMHRGTELTDNIDASTDKIPVTELYDEEGKPIFYVGDDISIGKYESARVLSIDEKRHLLTVERGYVREAQSHDKGVSVQTHVRFWPGSWVMNVTAACPEEQVLGVTQPVDYITYFHLLTQNKVQGLYETVEDNPLYMNINGAGYDGFVIDRFEDHQSWLQWLDDEKRPIDIFLDGRVLEDETFDLLVQETVDQYTDLLKKMYGDLLIIRNNALTTRPEGHNGQVYESFGWDEPNREWWRHLFINGEQTSEISDYGMLSYLEWFKVREDALVYVEVYEDEGDADSDGDGSYKNPFESIGFKPDIEKARFSLTSTLLGDGFYSYEINTNGHGALGLMWFDFYDNGGKGQGYLGYPLEEAREISDGVYIRAYQHGLVLVNVSDEKVYPEFNKEVIATTGFNYEADEGIDPFEGCIFMYKE